MKICNHLLAYTLVALTTLCSQPLSAQLRLSKIITDEDTTHYTYDAKGQITKIVSGENTYRVERTANKIYVTPADSLYTQIIISNDPKTLLTTSVQRRPLLSVNELEYTESDEDEVEAETETEAEVAVDSIPFHYDSNGRLIDNAPEGFPEERVLFQNNRLYSFGTMCESLSYPTSPLPAEVQACIKAIPNFSLCLLYKDTDLLSHVLPLARLGASLDGTPTSGKAVLCVLPYNELDMPDQDSPEDPFIDLVDARTSRLMDIEAVRPSMQVEQAVSEEQEREEMWLTLQQYDDFMAYVEQMSAAHEDMPDTDLPQRMTAYTDVRYTYTLTKTPEGQRALRVDFTPEDTTKLSPTDILFHKTVTFVFE